MSRMAPHRHGLLPESDRGTAWKWVVTRKGETSIQMKVMTVAYLASMAAAAQVMAQENTAAPQPLITVDAGAPRRAVSPEMYGIFFEEISHAGDGGLYAELVQNRDMEASTIPTGWRQDPNQPGQLVKPLGGTVNTWFDSDLPAWSPVAEGGARGAMTLDVNNPLNDRNPHSLKLVVTSKGTRCGIANSGYWGMNIQAGEWYDATFYARTESGGGPRGGGRGVGLVFSLETGRGKKVCARATIPEIGGAWRKYTLALHAEASDPNCRLVITPIEPTTMWFDVVSLFPRKTFKNRPNGMRADVAQMLVDMKPGFLRFPGGCVVEGYTLPTRFRWKDSIGDIAQRKGGFNLWGYYTTYGLGFHEYLQLAEDLGAEAMYVCNVGMSCASRRRLPQETATEPNDVQAFVQGALDALEYAMGPATSEWGAKRVANGRAEPFRIKYVEIGNENGGPVYQAHYEVFYEAIKAKYPQVTTIADQRMQNMPIEFVDDHFYVNPARFFDMANQYDDADRNGPKIYVGEYAVNNGVGTGNLLGGLAEAVYMFNMERNCDIVKMCSYAPLFENVNQRNWSVNLILLDSSRVVGRSSYQIQKLFAAHRPDVVLQTEVKAQMVALEGVPAGRGRGRGPAQPETTPPQWAQVQQVYALAGLDLKRGEVIIKAVNPTPSPVTATVTLKGLTKVGAKAKVYTLAHADAKAENTLDKPNVIVPKESDMTVAGAQFPVNLPANSVTILRLAAK
jgi:alpha-L-arabinofuranosidase